MAVTVNIVAGFGAKITQGNVWTPIYSSSCGPSDGHNVDQAKFKSLTLCNLEATEIEAHIAVFHRSTFSGTTLTTEYPTGGKGIFLHHKLKLPVGATFQLDDFYMDTFLSSGECEAGTDEPIVAIWLETSEELSNGVDVIHRR
tara:strand:- start:492 stop:920 length:429 start_codon:yes stop_codon:yes gene_type:complete